MKKILGLGNALVDIIMFIDRDELLNELNLPKGSMQLVDIERSNAVYKATKAYERSMASGGSAANTINGLARLGNNAGYIGKVTDDELGKFFEENLLKNNINPILLKSEAGTGKVMALISEDKERTFATYLGAAVEMMASDIKKEMFEGYDIFHVEGYLVQNNELIEQSLKFAKESGLTTSIDLASYNVVEDNLEFLKHLVANYVDIVFANEEEAKAFTGMEPFEALNEISKSCEIAIVKVGKDGAYIKKDDVVVKVDAIKAEVVDTNGAGDLFAAGFLFGFANNKNLRQCGDYGALLAGNVIEVIGASIDEERWKKIKEKI